MKNLFEGWGFCQTILRAREGTAAVCRYGKIMGSPQDGWYAVRYFRNDSRRFYEGYVVLVQIADMADWVFFEDEDELNRHIRLS